MFLLVIVASHVVAQIAVEPADPAGEDAVLELRHHPLLLHLGLVSPLHAAHCHRLWGGRCRQCLLMGELAVGDPQARGGGAVVWLSPVGRD